MITFPSTPASAREPVKVIAIDENKRQVGEPMRSAPSTRMVRTVSDMLASANISSLESGIVICVKVAPGVNEHAVIRTLVDRGSVTEPVVGTAPFGQVDASSHRFRSAPKCGQSVRVFAEASSGGVGMTGMMAGSPGALTSYSIEGADSTCAFSVLIARLTHQRMRVHVRVSVRLCRCMR